MRRTILLITVVFLCSGAEDRRSGGSEMGLVKEITKERVTVVNKDGKYVTFTPNDNLKKGIDDGKEKEFNAKLKEIKVGQSINVLYRRDKTTSALICTHVRIMLQPPPRDRPGGMLHEGTVQEVKADGFTIVDNDGKAVTLRPTDNLKNGIDDRKARLFNAKLKDMKVGQLVSALYKFDVVTGEFICTHIRILRERAGEVVFTEWTVKEITKENFRIANNDGVSLRLKPNDNLKKGVDDGKETLFNAKLKDMKVGQAINVRFQHNVGPGGFLATHFRILKQPKNDK